MKLSKSPQFWNSFTEFKFVSNFEIYKTMSIFFTGIASRAGSRSWITAVSESGRIRNIKCESLHFGIIREVAVYFIIGRIGITDIINEVGEEHIVSKLRGNGNFFTDAITYSNSHWNTDIDEIID